MKKRPYAKKMILIFASLLIIGCTIPLLVYAQSGDSSSVIPDPTEGMTGFNTTNVYKMSHTLSELPHSFEAWIKVPTDIPDDTRVGTLFSNFKSGSSGFCLDVRTNGAPTFWYYNVDNKLVRISFDVDVRTGEYMHLVMVHDDANGQLRCYVNGEEKGCVTEAEKNLNFAFDDAVMCNLPFVFGCDNRPNYPFNGSIARFAAYNEPLTADSVKNIYKNGVDTSSESLVIHYETPTQPTNFIADLSGNGNHVTLPSFQNEGMTFKTGDTEELMWRMPENLTAAPLTFETWIKVPTDVGNGRVGNIFSNYIGSGNSGIVFDIHVNGMPRIYFRNSDKATVNTATAPGMFDQIDVRTGEFLHLVLVNDPTKNTLSCYVNGKLIQTLEYSNTAYDTAEVLKYPFSLGGDNRTNSLDGTSYNQYPFKGMIKSFAAYSTVLTDSQIMSCYSNGTSVSTKGLIAYYNVTKQPTGDVIDDLSGKHNYLGRFVSDGMVERPTDYAYSFAVIGDTQYIIEKDALNGTNEINILYDWILKNADDKKIAAVFGLGDITDNHTNALEWSIAQNAIKKLDGNIPYYLVRGNHDNTDYYNSYMDSEIYRSQFSDPDADDQSVCFYDPQKIDNAYTKFTVGETKYLFMLLDYGAKDPVLEWAGNVIAANPEYRVIISTHGYLSEDGAPLDTEWYSPDPTGSRPYNNGVEMWDKLISRYSNIYLVLSGHDPYAEGYNIVHVQTEGINGNIVNQMLIDPQSLDNNKTQNYGMVAMLYFSEDGRKVSVEYI